MNCCNSPTLRTPATFLARHRHNVILRTSISPDGAAVIPPRSSSIGSRRNRSRAHIYGGGVVALSTPAQLAAALDAGTTLKVPLNGVTLTACFGTGAGCTNLAGLTTYEQIASAVASALNASPVTLGTITGTIAPVSMPINVGVWRDTAYVQVNSVGGTLYNGAYVCAKSKPCLSSSSDQINQIENQMIWAPETVLRRAWMVFLV